MRVNTRRAHMHKPYPFHLPQYSFLLEISVDFQTSFRFLFRASLVAQMVKRLPAMQETQFWFLGWEDPLEKEMATHSSILAWRIPWTEEPGGLQSIASHRVSTTEVTQHAHKGVWIQRIKYCLKLRPQFPHLLYHKIILSGHCNHIMRQRKQLCTPYSQC